MKWGGSWSVEVKVKEKPDLKIVKFIKKFSKVLLRTSLLIIWFVVFLITILASICYLSYGNDCGITYELIKMVKIWFV